MPSAKDIQNLPKSFLVLGPTGSGKTTLFTTFPGKKLIYIFDPGTLDTIKGMEDVDYEYYPPDTTLGLRRTQKGRPDPKAPKFVEPRAYASFEDDLELRLTTDRFGGYDAIGFCSVTTLSVMTMDRLLFIQGRGGQQPEISDYNMLGETLLAIFRSVIGKATQEGVLVFIEGHIDLVQDELSKRIQNQFDVTKAVRRLLPRLVTDVWVALSEQQGEGVGYKIQTANTKEYPLAKNSMGLKFYEDVTINEKLSRHEQGMGKFIRNLKLRDKRRQ